MARHVETEVEVFRCPNCRNLVQATAVWLPRTSTPPAGAVAPAVPKSMTAELVLRGFTLSHCCGVASNDYEDEDS